MSFKLRLVMFRLMARWGFKVVGDGLVMLAVAFGTLVCPAFTAWCCDKGMEKTR